MPSFRIKVPNNDEGEDLGEYVADYLPRVGDRFALHHPLVCAENNVPFIGVVESVEHEAYAYHRGVKPSPEESEDLKDGFVNATVWLVEELTAPTLYCDCSEEERAKHPVVDGACDNCGHARRS